MARLIDEIASFLKENGFNHSHDKHSGMDVIRVHSPESVILPLEISARSPEAAEHTAMQASAAVESICRTFDSYPLIIPEDRWRRDYDIITNRLTAHLGKHKQAYARNCEVRRIDKNTAAAFLKKAHSYGDAACKYRYGLFLKRAPRHTSDLKQGDLIAVAEFSGARRWIKEEHTIRSYEWTRYASVPELRVSGGMGKLLKAFIKEVRPDDIMSYADLEWSQGKVYRQLGFELEGVRDTVCFAIDPSDWTRHTNSENIDSPLYFHNFGSNKYRLKLTEYFIPLQPEKTIEKTIYNGSDCKD